MSEEKKSKTTKADKVEETINKKTSVLKFKIRNAGSSLTSAYEKEIKQIKNPGANIKKNKSTSIDI